MFHQQQPFPAAPAATIRSLNSNETKETIDAWFNQTKAFIRAIPAYARYMDLTWSSHATSVTRGFQLINEGTVQLSPAVQSTQVEALIDLVCTYAPELDVSHIREEATSLRWIYNYIREHYGCRRTGRQMMQKFSTLKRRPDERLNAFWNRWKGFYAENRIRKNDDIKISENGVLKTADKDEIGERYRLSSDIVSCLYAAHPDLPTEVEKLLSSKLENQDVASLEREIFVKANIALEQIERKGTSVRRTNPMQRQATRRPAGPAQTRSGAVRKPTKPDHYCSSCMRHPDMKSAASSHYIKDCPYLSKSDKDYLLKLHDKALQNRLLSVEDRDPSVSVRFVEMVEAYYGLVPEHNQVTLADDDLLPDETPSSACMDALADLDISIVKVSGTFDQINLKRFTISPSPILSATVYQEGREQEELFVVDTGCTGEMIINEKCAQELGLKITPTHVKTAKMADNDSVMKIIGGTSLTAKVNNKSVKFDALVSHGGDRILLGIPGAEKLCLMIDCATKTIKFQDGTRIPYKTVSCNQCDIKMQQVNVRRHLMRTEKGGSKLLPNEVMPIHADSPLPDGLYAIEPSQESSGDKWLVPTIAEIKNNKATIKNKSEFVQCTAGKTVIAQAFQVQDPDSFAKPTLDEMPPASEPEPTFKDVVIDPDNILSHEVKTNLNMLMIDFKQFFSPTFPDTTAALVLCKQQSTYPATYLKPPDSSNVLGIHAKS